MTVDHHGDASLYRDLRARNGTQLKPPSQITAIVNAVNEQSFRDWYQEREYRRNIKEGRSYFNGPSSIPDPRRHSPSSLLQCKRRLYYQQLNAPEESRPPYGLFWFGSRFEEDILLEYLDESIVRSNEYVTNSMWVDFIEDSIAGDLQIKGVTDPVIVTEDATPLVPTEIKTKRSLEHLDAPDEHHLAQTHAYMAGLSRENDQQIHHALIIYGSRTTLDIKSFHVTFDEDFWVNQVLEWAGNHSIYRLNSELPPAEPRFDWECSVCSYRERCGKGDREFADIKPEGLLQLFVYPLEKLTEYLETHGGKLTPTLAHHYPELTGDYDVYDWRCRGCESTFSVNSIDWSGNVSSPPKCPTCADDGSIRFLAGPSPSEQSRGVHHGD